MISKTDLRKNRLQKNGMVKRLGGYVRVSTGHQAKEGVSLAAQKDRIEQFCEFSQIELVETVEDNVSGTKPFAERPGGQRILELIEAGEIDGVVITKLDRAFRNVIDCLTMAAAWKESRVAFHILDFAGNQLDTGSAIGRFMFHSLSAMAQLERDMTAERTAEALAKRRTDGKNIGRGKFGWTLDRDGETLVPHAVQQEALKFIMSRHSLKRNKWGMKKMATWLQKNGIPKVSDLWWTRKEVRFVLDNQIVGMTNGQKDLRNKLVASSCPDVPKLRKMSNHMRTLVRMANSSVIPPFPENGNRWSWESVSSILKNPLVAEEPTGE